MFSPVCCLLDGQCSGLTHRWSPGFFEEPLLHLDSIHRHVHEQHWHVPDMEEWNSQSLESGAQYDHAFCLLKLLLFTRAVAFTCIQVNHSLSTAVKRGYSELLCDISRGEHALGDVKLIPEISSQIEKVIYVNIYFTLKTHSKSVFDCIFVFWDCGILSYLHINLNHTLSDKKLLINEWSWKTANVFNVIIIIYWIFLGFYFK